MDPLDDDLVAAVVVVVVVVVVVAVAVAVMRGWLVYNTGTADDAAATACRDIVVDDDYDGSNSVWQ